MHCKECNTMINVDHLCRRCNVNLKDENHICVGCAKNEYECTTCIIGKKPLPDDNYKKVTLQFGKLGILVIVPKKSSQLNLPNALTSVKETLQEKNNDTK
jgi:hypothetical protein